MRYENSRFVLNNCIQSSINFRLGNWIQGGSWLIQYDKRGLLIQRSRNSNLLRFSAGDFHSILIEILIEGRL